MVIIIVIIIMISTSSCTSSSTSSSIITSSISIMLSCVIDGSIIISYIDCFSPCTTMFIISISIVGREVPYLRAKHCTPEIAQAKMSSQNAADKSLDSSSDTSTGQVTILCKVY